MTPQGERLLAALESEIKSISKLEHEMARTKVLLKEQVTRLRLGANPELVLTSLKLSLPHERTLALLERVDPVLSTPAEPQTHGASEARNDDSGAAGGGGYGLSNGDHVQHLTIHANSSSFLAGEQWVGSGSVNCGAITIPVAGSGQAKSLNGV